MFPLLVLLNVSVLWVKLIPGVKGWSGAHVTYGTHSRPAYGTQGWTHALSSLQGQSGSSATFSMALAAYSMQGWSRVYATYGAHTRPDQVLDQGPVSMKSIDHPCILYPGNRAGSVWVPLQCMPQTGPVGSCSTHLDEPYMLHATHGARASMCCIWHVGLELAFTL